MKDLEKKILRNVRYGDFTLTSGIDSKCYIDVKELMTDIETLKFITRLISNLVNSNITKVVGMELGGVPLAIGVALKKQLPYVIFRKRVADKMFIGDLTKDDIVILIEDVITTGGSVIHAVETMNRRGVKVEFVIAIVDREEGAREKLAEFGINLITYTTMTKLGLKK